METTERDRIRGVVHQDLDAGEGLKRSNIAALLADHPPFVLFVGQRHMAHGGRFDLLGGIALDGSGDDLARFALGFRFGALLDLPDLLGEEALGFLLDLADEQLFHLFCRQPRELFEALALPNEKGFPLRDELVQSLEIILEGLFHAQQLDALLLETLFFLEQARFESLQLLFLALEAPLQLLLTGFDGLLGLGELGRLEGLGLVTRRLYDLFRTLVGAHHLAAHGGAPHHPSHNSHQER
jgi:hypothetical protein